MACCWCAAKYGRAAASYMSSSATLESWSCRSSVMIVIKLLAAQGVLEPPRNIMSPLPPRVRSARKKGEIIDKSWQSPPRWRVAKWGGGGAGIICSSAAKEPWSGRELTIIVIQLSAAREVLDLSETHVRLIPSRVQPACPPLRCSGSQRLHAFATWPRRAVDARWGTFPEEEIVAPPVWHLGNAII